MRLFRLGLIARVVFPEAIFRTDTNNLCLTFDDGPHPVSTPALLELLKKYAISAVFFCSGEAAEKYPHLVSLIASNGHIIGNHGYSHADGWKTATWCYVENIRKADQFTSSTLMRPPYGKMRPGQYRILKKYYRIVLWDVMPFDFDRKFGIENVLAVLKRKIRPGSIVVLHDNPSSCASQILGEFIKFALVKGYTFTTELGQ